MAKQVFKNTCADALKGFWTNYFGWGRATRSEYWWTALIYGLLASVLTFCCGLFSIWMLATIIPRFTLFARRLHDTGCSNWLSLLGLLPIIGWIALLCILCQKGEPCKNKYGAPRI